MLTIGDFTGSHVYTAPNTYTVTISINDNEGQTTSETFTVQVVVPVIQTIPTQTVNEGSTLTLSERRRSAIPIPTDHIQR